MSLPLPRALVVSLHDVSPRTWEPCRHILKELQTLGAVPVSLLVIPDHHGTGSVAGCAEFARWLREEEAAGGEIVSHGYCHQRTRRPEESLATRLTTRIYTADEGEFYDLSEADAGTLAGRGRSELQALGLSPRGFIAPAWLLGAAAERALPHAGVEYTVRLRTVSDFQNGRVWHSQSLVWSVRSNWRRACSVAWNALLFRTLRANPLLRISLHPVDVAHPRIWRQIRSLLHAALADRIPLTYGSWIDLWRSSIPLPCP